MGASQKTMPEAQIPIVIMTPNVSVLQIQKQKIQQHPHWEPYAYSLSEISIAEEVQSKNEYCKFRRWIINREIEFVEKRKGIIAPKPKKEETKTLHPS